MTVRHTAILFLLALLLAGCGFHLRGAIDLPADLQPMHLQGISKYSAFGLELKRTLEGNGVEIVDNVAAARVVLKLTNVRYDRRLLTVSAQSGKVTEYELHYSAEVSLHDRKGTVLLAPQRLQQIRDYTYDQNNILGKGNEEALIRKDMQRALVRQILNRLQARSRG